MPSQNKILVLCLLLVASLTLGACQTAGTPTPKRITEVIVETIVVTEVVESESTKVVQVVTDTPEPVEELERTLVICQDEEPDNLYIFGSDEIWVSHILHAVYDGPIDSRSFDYQPVILEKLPSLADGDVVILSTLVKEGDTVIDNHSNIVGLAEGLLVRPAGCRSHECAIEYEGGDLEMDQMQATFKLLPGITWSDGTLLTASDSVYSFNLQSDPDTPTTDRYIVDSTASYEALDDLTTQWTGLPGYMDPTYFTNFFEPMPEHIWDQYTAAELIEAEESSLLPVGWGAYVIDEWVQGDHISLYKNPNYYRADEGLPAFDHVVFRFTGSNPQATIAKLLSGECDVTTSSSHLMLQSERLLELHASGKLNTDIVIGTSIAYLQFGIVPAIYDDGWQPGDRPDFFGDVRTRQAIAYCLNRQDAVDEIMPGSMVIDTYLPPQHPLFNTNVTHYEFEVETGISLLEEAGWMLGDDYIRVYAGDNPNIPPGTPLSLDLWGGATPATSILIKILGQSLTECGIEANLESWDLSEYFADGPEGLLFGRRFDLSIIGWLSGVTPPCDLWMSSGIPRDEDNWSGQNDTGYSNPEYDAACNTALQALPGEPAYEENNLLAQEIFADQLPVVPLFPATKLAATRPDFCGFFLDPTENSGMWNIEEFDYGPDC